MLNRFIKSKQVDRQMEGGVADNINQEEYSEMKMTCLSSTTITQ